MALGRFPESPQPHTSAFAFSWSHPLLSCGEVCWLMCRCVSVQSLTPISVSLVSSLAIGQSMDGHIISGSFHSKKHRSILINVYFNLQSERKQYSNLWHIYRRLTDVQIAY